jgi:hypothetical protein
MYQAAYSRLCSAFRGERADAVRAEPVTPVTPHRVSTGADLLDVFGSGLVTLLGRGTTEAEGTK